MGYYKNQLNKFEETHMNLWEILVADEVTCIFDEDELTDEEFEIICYFVYDWIMNSEMSANELVHLIRRCLRDGEFTIQEMDEDPGKITDILNDHI